MESPVLILGIDTSCDDTSASVVADGRRIFSNVVSSQNEIHKKYGGIVPELASRKHIEMIWPVVDEALETAGTDPERLSAVAVCYGPGLIGSLLVGCAFAKSLSYTRSLPLIGINHLEGHIFAAFLTDEKIGFPFLSLVVSGGHTAIYRIDGYLEYAEMGHTRDDAAGEAYDKVAKMLGLGYPGGPVIDRLAEKGDAGAVEFPRPYLPGSFDFSFSGLKTSVKRYIDTHEDYRSHVNDIAASFQEACVDVLAQKLISAALENKCFHVAVVGGVAANPRLRQRVLNDAKRHGLDLFIPPVPLCGDNAAMIAAAAFHRLSGDSSRVGELSDDIYSRVGRRL